MNLCDEIKAAMPIEEAFRADGHEIRTVRGQFVCLCPFHQEKTPSCYVTPGVRGRFKCFGACGATGSVIDYYALTRGISPAVAIKELATRLNGSSVTASTEHVPVRKPAQQAEGARALPRLPDLETGSHAEFRSLAAVRLVSVEAVQLASERGFIHFCKLTDGPDSVTSCVLTDHTRRNAQARRLDGERWQYQWNADAKDWLLVGPYDRKKVRGFTGNQASWPLGIEEAHGFESIAIVEGIDLLAAFHFLHAEARETEVAPVAILGASNRIPADALNLFAGKRVRIFAHADANYAGMRAAAQWQEQLEPIVAHVDAFDFRGAFKINGDPVKDLNDVTTIDPDCFESQRALWSMMTF
jgi:hypothetical protein